VRRAAGMQMDEGGRHVGISQATGWLSVRSFGFVFAFGLVAAEPVLAAVAFGSPEA
jgi:hypothetical protein